jgi:hypothetical protein
MVILALGSMTSCVDRRPVQASAPPPPPPVQAYQMPPPPPWAPFYYHTDQVRYYYLPDMQCYYDVYLQQYVYFDGFQWVHNSFPPPSYTGYDMNNCYVVVLNQGVNTPWVNHNAYVANYPRGYYNNSNSGNNGSGNTGQSRRGYNENDKAFLTPNTGTRVNSTPAPASNQPREKTKQQQQAVQETPASAPVKSENYNQPAPAEHKEQPAPKAKENKPAPAPKPAKKAPANTQPGKQSGKKQDGNGY